MEKGQNANTNVIKVAVVEDEKHMADVFLEMLSRYEQEKMQTFQVAYFSCTTDFLSADRDFDIVFMDINFQNDMDGIRASHKLRERNNKTLIIFVTSFSSFAVKGYEVEAFDFIVKPVVYVDFALRMTRAIKRVNINKPAGVVIRNGAAVKRLDVNEIKYIEIFKHKLIYHTTKGDIESYGTLGAVEEELPENIFFRCNKYAIVNFRYVKNIDGGALTVDGEVLSLSRSKRKECIEAFTRYWSR